MDFNSLAVAKAFFGDVTECPLCSQREHLQKLVTHIEVKEPEHEPLVCLYSWISIIAILDNWQNSMSADELKMWVDRMIANVQSDMDKAKRMGY